MELYVDPSSRRNTTGPLNGTRYQTQLRTVESLIQNSFDFETAQDIYAQLLNDKTLPFDAQRVINTHIVTTYKQYGEVHYERQLSALFFMVRDDMKVMHQAINLQLANQFNDVYPCSVGQVLSDEFKSLGIPQAHLHIASVLGHTASSNSLATMYAEGKLVNRNMDQAIAYAEQAKDQGDCDAVFDLGVLCKKLGETDNEMAVAAQTCFQLAASEFHMKAVSEITQPGITTDIRSEKKETRTSPSQSITTDDKPTASNEMTASQLIELAELEQISKDKTVFGKVDELIAHGQLKEAEAELRVILNKEFNENPVRKFTEREAQNLFNEQTCISNAVDNWYCDHGPVYTRVALKLAKIRTAESKQLTISSENAQKKLDKVEELIDVINATGNSRHNKDIKLALGEWYLSIAPLDFGFSRSTEEQRAIELLQEINLKIIPDAYSRMKVLAHEISTLR